MKRLLAAGSMLAALVVLTPGVAPAAAPPDHYANHPIRVRPNASTSPTGGEVEALGRTRIGWLA